MDPQIKELTEKRVALVVQARAITDKAWAENKRELRADESEQFDRVMDEVDSLKKRIDELERLSKAEEDDGGGAADGDADRDDHNTDEDDEDEYDRSARDTESERRTRERHRREQARRGGPRTPPGGGASGPERRVFESQRDYETRVRRSSPEYGQVFWRWLEQGDSALSTRAAQRAIQADSDIVGGYMIAPQEFVAKLIKFVDNILWIRQEAEVTTVSAAQSLGAPSLDQDVADADWTSELDTGNEDTSMQFGKRELTPRPLAKRLKVSNKLLRLASLAGGMAADNSVKGGGPEGLLLSRLGYKFAVSEEKAFLLGNGTNQPLGLFVASSRGISTGRDVLTGLSTGFTADGLIDAKYNMKVQYWPYMKWLFNRTCLQSIRKLKDANGQYLWVPSGMGSIAGFSQGSDKGKKIGDTLLDLPVMASEYAPNTQTTGLYGGLLGDFRFYWIADSEQMTVQRLVELYAAANQTGFIARMELDGMPVLEEAFVRLKFN